MKKVLSVFCFALLGGALPFVAQAQTTDVRAATSLTEKATNGTTASGQTDKPSSTEQEKLKEQPTTASAIPLTTPEANSRTSDAPGKTMATVPGAAASDNSVSGPPPESIYRVGAGDVLDIRLLNAQTRESTLYTILPGGLLEYPLISEPLKVGGLTTDEIDARLTAEVKVYENPQIIVSVRDYVSHKVIITGLVNDPGTKFLRREAVPLYVVLAEALPRPDAGRALILRPGGQSITVELSDTKATSTLVYPNDVITLSAAPPAAPQFFYIGGPVVSPGQKDFHAGMTLTQAVFTAGGVTRFAGSKVKILRQGPNGLLVSTEHNLKQIEAGKIPDPVLEAGDRIEVSRGGW